MSLLASVFLKLLALKDVVTSILKKGPVSENLLAANVLNLLNTSAHYVPEIKPNFKAKSIWFCNIRSSCTTPKSKLNSVMTEAVII